MSLRTRLIALAAASLPVLAPAAALAADPQLKLPKFEHLQRNATESVNITIGKGLLHLASFALRHDKHKRPEDAQALEILSGLKAIYIRSYEFPEDNMYSQSDIDAVRAQLTGPGWTPLAQVRQRRTEADAEDVDVYVSLENDKVNGLAVVASGARKFTIVNIVGSIDPEKLADVEERFGIPEHAL